MVFFFFTAFLNFGDYLFAFAQNTPVFLVLKPTGEKLSPEEFYLKGVQGDQSSIGKIYTSSGADILNIQGGVTGGLEDYFFGSLAQNTSLRPVTLRVNQLEVKEKRGSQNGRIEGAIKLDFSFLLHKGDSLVHLLDYQGGANYKRSLGSFAVVSSAMQQSLDNSLRYFNSWIASQAATNIHLATGVQLEIEDYSEIEKGDTVFYHRERPLVWDDFSARAQAGSGFSASIFTSFAWEGDSEVVNGIVRLKLLVKVFMLKSSSWVKPAVKDAYGLKHEQTHFDITKLVVERFKEKVSRLELGVEDFDGQVGYLYIETYREMNQLQEAYDKETSHGQDKQAQQKWNDRISAELDRYLKE